MAEEKPDSTTDLNDAEWNALFDELGFNLHNLKQQAVGRPVSALEIDYLLRQWAYLDICSAEASESFPDVQPAIIKPKKGWDIHDYGQRLIASPGRWLFGPYNTEDEDQGGTGRGTQFTGTGTVIQQIVDTADSMIQVAASRWTNGARIREGYSLMQFAAWTAAQIHGYSLSNFEPSLAQQEAFKHLIKAKNISLPSETIEPQERPR